MTAVKEKIPSKVATRGSGRKTGARTNSIKKEIVLSNSNAIPITEKITIIKEGISKKQLESIKEETALDYDTLSMMLLVSRATLIKKKGAEKFDQPTSERIMLLADIISYGQEVFEDKERFNTWMRKENKALGRKTPLELMDTVYGMEEIKKELARIEYGVF